MWRWLQNWPPTEPCREAVKFAIGHMVGTRRSTHEVIMYRADNIPFELKFELPRCDERTPHVCGGDVAESYVRENSPAASKRWPRRRASALLETDSARYRLTSYTRRGVERNLYIHLEPIGTKRTFRPTHLQTSALMLPRHLTCQPAASRGQLDFRRMRSGC